MFDGLSNLYPRFLVFCLFTALCACKILLPGKSYGDFFIHTFPKKFIGFLATHLALLSYLSPKLEEISDKTDWLLGYVPSFREHLSLRVSLSLYFSPTGRWLSLNLIPFLWLRASLLHLKNSTHLQPNIALRLLKLSILTSLGLFCIECAAAAVWYGHGKIQVSSSTANNTISSSSQDCALFVSVSLARCNLLGFPGVDGDFSTC
jgi:hypothetical protein